MKESFTILLFGRSGSGKGTQAKLLQDFLKTRKRHVLSIETGQLLREASNLDTFGGHLVKFNIEKGRLVPACLPIWAWTNKLMHEATPQSDIILDGFCRRQEEVLVAEQALQFFERFNIHVVYINTSKDECLKRMKNRGRADDTDEYIKSRLDWFDYNTMPALSLLKDYRSYSFHEINGNQPVNDVFAELCEKIFELNNSKIS